MELSLNAGAELDDEHPHPLTDEDFFESPVSGELPAVREDRDFIAVIESQMSDITYLTQDIVKTRGMNQSFALEALRVCPTFDPSPVGFYTKTTTATRYASSLESLLDGFNKLIEKIAKAIKTIIRRVLAWFTGNKIEGDLSDSDYAKTKAAVRRAAEDRRMAFVELHDTYMVNEERLRSSLNGAGAEIKTYITSHDTTYGAAGPYEAFSAYILSDPHQEMMMQEILNHNDLVYYDALTNGPFFKTVVQLTEKMKSQISFVNLKLMQFETLIKDLNGKDSSGNQVQTFIASLNDSTSPFYGFTDSQDIGKTLTHLRDDIVTPEVPWAMDQFLKARGNYQSFLTLFSQSQGIPEYAEDLVKMESTLSAFSDSLVTLLKSKLGDDASVATQEQVQSSLHWLQTQVAGLVLAFKAICDLGERLRNKEMNFAKFTGDLAGGLIKGLEKLGKDVPADLKQAYGKYKA